MLADKVLQLMAEKGWSKREAAKRCGIPYMTFINITLGKRKKIWPETMQKLAKGFEVSLLVLMDAEMDREIDLDLLITKLKQLDNFDRERVIRELGMDKNEAQIFTLLRSKKLDSESLQALKFIIEKIKGP